MKCNYFKSEILKYHGVISITIIFFGNKNVQLDNPSYFQLKQCQNEKKVSERTSKSFLKTFCKNSQEEFMSGQPRRNDIAPKYRNCCQHSPYNVKFINSSKMLHDSNSLKRFAQPLDNNFQQVFGDLSDQNNNQTHERDISLEEIVLPSVILNKKICSNCIPSNSVKHGKFNMALISLLYT